MVQRITALAFVLCVIQAMCLAGPADEGVPQLINYQGRLADADGKPVTAMKLMVFRFYNAGTAGDLLGGFQEAQNVAVTRGIFNVLIGSSTIGGVPLEIFAGPSVYLSVTVADEELLPRQRITSVGYAFKSAEADHAAESDYAETAGLAINALSADTAQTSQTAQTAQTAQNLADPSVLDTRFVNKSGDVMSGNLSAPAIIDSDNTAYYADPSGQTRLNDLRANIFYDLSNTSFFVQPSSISYLDDIRASIFRDRNDATYYLDPAGVSRLNDFRANILYDLDNTSYYINPASSSVVNNLTVTGTLSSNQLDSRYLRKDLTATAVQSFMGDIDLRSAAGLSYLHPNATNANNWTCIASQVFNSPYYYGPNSTDDIYIGESNPVHIQGNLYTPRFYDMNNTSFYADPASTSHFNDLRASILYDRDNTAYYVNPAATTRLNTVLAESVKVDVGFAFQTDSGVAMLYVGTNGKLYFGNAAGATYQLSP